LKFTVEYKIRFQHCDAFGIVFYPRYFTLLSQVVEDWFEELEVNFTNLHVQKSYGIPLVHTEVDFLRASRLGEKLRFELTLSDLGKSSFKPHIEAYCDDEVRLKADYVNVLTASTDGNLETIPIPEDIKTKMQAYLVD
jgi:4-hydroxybenzoyl-CoA thioesterase